MSTRSRLLTSRTRRHVMPLPGMLLGGGGLLPPMGGGIFPVRGAPFSLLTPGVPQFLFESTAGTFQDAARSTPATADADPVGGWADQSGSGNNASQSTDAKRPVLKLNVLNGFPVVRFDGADGGDALEAGAVGTGAGLTYFAVGVRRGVPGNNACLAALKKGSGNNDYDGAGRAILGFFPAATRLSAFRNNAELSTAGAWPAVGTAFIHASLFDGANHTSYLNGVAGAAVASVGNFDFTSAIMAARWYSDAEQNPHLQIDFASVVLYPFALPPGDVSRVFAYLNNRWGGIY